MTESKPWREAVGGLWDEIGKLQFDFLIKNGLCPHHFLLDVGCGSLRGGIHFIEYLERGHYFGVDKNSHLLDGGIVELKEHDLINKSPILKTMEDFDFVSLNQKFDFALAQSVFTHLPLEHIRKCLINIEKVLNDGGKFYATFFEKIKKENHDPITFVSSDGMVIKTYSDRDPYNYTFTEFESACRESSLTVEYVGDWNHPRKQKIMLFTKN